MAATTRLAISARVTEAAPWLVALFALLMVALMALAVVVRITTPWDGLRWTHRDLVTGEAVRLQPVDATSAIAAGDRLVAIGGVPIAEVTRRPFDVRPLPAEGALEYEVLNDGVRRVVRVDLVDFDPALLLHEWPSYLLLGTWLGIGVAVFRRRPHDAAAQVMLIMGSAFLPGTFWAWSSVSDLMGGGVLALNAVYQPAYAFGLMAMIGFVAVYPTPWGWASRHRRLVALACLLPVAATLVVLLGAQLTGPPLSGWVADMATIETTLYLVGAGALAVMLPLRYRSLGDPLERRRVLLVVGSLALAAAGVVLLWVLPVVLWGDLLVPPSLMALVGLPVPIALAIAVLRYNAFDLQLLLNRSLVYGGATAAIALIYIVLVAAAILAVHERFGFAVALLATGLVILIAQPLRDGIQRAVNRLMYGDRDDPYRGIARLSERLEDALPADRALPVVVETIASSLRLPYVAIERQTDTGSEILAARGEPLTEPVAVPLVHQSELVGRLLAAPRVGEDQLSVMDRRVLTALATQVSATIRTMDLDLELRRSRDRLVAAREEERRRLGRELHDGVGPTLAGSLLQLRAARLALAADPQRAEELLEKLEEDTRQAITEVRRLARELRPPALDALGLVGALRERADHFSAHPGLTIELDAPEPLPPLSAAAEVAVYRIVLEAVANVVRHSEASHCTIALSLADDLVVRVVDDGRGLPGEVRSGVGMRSMRERAAEMGGRLEVRSGKHGTTVEAHLPLESVAPA